MESNEIDLMNSDSDIDAVVIGRDDISNYNPDQILPQRPEVIQQIRTWLQPTSYDIAGGEYQKHLASHVAGTGAWLTSSNIYKQWLEDDQQGLLWIKGIPGSGKSVMAATLIDELAKANPGCPVLFFFFRQIIEANYKPKALLCDWMDQILNYSPPLQQKLASYVDSRRSIESISMEDMWKDLHMAFSGLPGKVFCVADALDEMDKNNSSFLQALAALGKWKPEKVKVLITSRPVPTIEGPLRNLPMLQIRLQENLVDIDIATYVRFTLSNSTIPESHWQTILNAVPGRANGLFLYAKLAMDAFIKPGADIQTVLKQLPSDLNVLYTSLLAEHAQRSGVPDSIQRLILQAVTHTARPLRLLELAEMIKVNNPDGTNRDLKANKDLIRAACGPLLEILADETVSVIHHSFTEYLKGTTRSTDDASGYPVLKIGPTHAQLAVACLQYLTGGCLESVVPNEEEENEEYVDYATRAYRRQGQVPKEEIELRLKHPFFEYATSNWSHHILKSEAAGQDQTDVNVKVRQFLDNERNREAWLQIKWNGERPSATGVTKLHIAAKLGLLSYVKELIQTVEPDVPDATGRTPLWWAAHMGHAAVVGELIKAGANPDQPESITGLKPLHEAAKSNHYEVVRVLLEAGVDPLTKKTMENPGRRCGNAPITVGHTPLMYACNNGHLEAVDAFLTFIKDIDTVHRALDWAAGNARSKVVLRILQYPGVDVNTKVHGNTPLYRACGSSADLATIRCLLEAGADPSIGCGDGYDEFAGIGGRILVFGEEKDARTKTCLHELCNLGTRGRYITGDKNSENLQMIFQLLVEAGADINQRGPGGGTALHGAAGSAVLTRLLLRAGADANATDDTGAAPLHHAQSVDPMVVLIEEGHADIDLAQKDGNTPLLKMLTSYHAETIVKFLEYGPNCKAVDNEGNGVLHISLQQWNTNLDILQGLLKGGADPNLKNKNGLTPLLHMRNDIKPSLMDILIEAGADINATDRNGKSLLFNKLTKFRSGDETYEDITELVKRGASIQARDRKGRTLLHEAVLRHDANSSIKSGVSQFDFLLGLGLDLHAVDHNGNGMLHELAMRSSNHESYHGQPLVSFWEHLLELGLDLKQPNYDGLTPLHILCSGNVSKARYPQGAIMPIDFVISATKDLNETDSIGATALHRAVTRGELYSKKLLDAGADPTLRTNEGVTPLHLACRCRQSNVIGMLLDELRRRTPSSDQAVIEVNAAASDKIDSTPLYYACRSGRLESVSLLLDAGADVKKAKVFAAAVAFESEDELWKTPLQKKEFLTGEDDIPLGLDDVRRFPQERAPYRHRGEVSEDETTRLEEILDMSVKNDLEGIDISQLDRRGWSSGYIKEAYDQKNDYAAACLTAIRDQHSAEADEKDKKSIPSSNLWEHLQRSSRDTKIQAANGSGLLTTGEVQQHIFLSLLARREFELIEVMAHQGVEFLNPQDQHGVSNFTVLVKYGYARLAKNIGNIVMEKGLENGNWHAFGDNTRPGLWFAKRNTSEAGDLTLNPRPLLLEATQRDLPNMPMIELLVERFGVDINEMFYTSQYVNGSYMIGPSDCPLHSVSRGNHWWHVSQALPYLLKAGADIHIRNYNGQTALHMALKADGNWPGPFNKQAAKLLIEAGADVNAVDNQGLSCLACAQHDVDLIKLLILHGAIVTADSVLAAIDAKSVPVLQALLSGGASANIRQDKPEDTPAAEKQKKNQRHFGPTEQLVPLHERFPLYHAGQHLREMTFPITKQGIRDTEAAFEVVQTLLDHGADPFAKFLRPDLTTPQASPKGSVEGYREATVLHELLYDGRMPEAYLRIPQLDVNRRDSSGYTLLHAACEGGNGPDYVLGSYRKDRAVDEKVTIFQQLLSLGADLEAVDGSSRNVLHHMISDHSTYGFNGFDQFQESLSEAIKKAPHLLDQADDYGATPLYAAVSRAAKKGRPDIAKLLLENGADHLKVNKDGQGLLHVLAPSLAKKRLGEFFEDLVKRGCDVNLRNSKGETPLFTFCLSVKRQQKHMFYYGREKSQEQLDVLPLMERMGADIFATDDKGRGLLHAAAGGDVDVFKQLMDRGLDVMLEDSAQQTPIDVAAACGNLEILELFEKKV